MMEFHYYLSILEEKEKEKPLQLVYFHVNSFDIGGGAYRVKRYIDQNWAVLLVAWRGFSGNIGNPIDKNLYIDGEAAIKWIIENTNYQFKDLVIYGESLGSGIALNWEENMNLPPLSWKLLSQQLQILHNNDIYFSNKIFN